MGKVYIETFSSRLCYFYKNHIVQDKEDTVLKFISILIGSNIRFEDSNMYFCNSHNKLVRFNTKSFKTTVMDDSFRSMNFKVTKNRIQYITPEFLSSFVKKEDYKTLRRILKEFVYLMESPEQNLSRTVISNILPASYHLGDHIHTTKAHSKVKEIDNNLFISYDKVEIFYNDPVVSKKSSINAVKLYFNKNELNFIEKSGKLFAINNPNPYSQITFRGSMYNLNRNEAASFIATSGTIYKLPIISFVKNHLQFDNYKYCFYSSRLQSMFVGMGGGMFLYKSDTRTMLTMKKTYSIFEDSRNTLWFSSTDSLFFTKDYLPNISTETPLVLNKNAKVFVNEIKEDQKGNMVFATNNGVYYYDPIRKLKYWLNDQNFLTSNECNRLEIDPKDNSLWIATFNGLNHVRYTEKNGKLKFERINRFFIDDNLYSNEINDILIQGDSVWIATPNGLNLLHNKNHRPDSIQVGLYFNKLFINENEREVVNPLKLNSDENNLTIDYSAIYYERRDRLLVRYRLIREGDTIEKFIATNKLNLLALKDGDYQFELYAYDQDYPYIQSETKRLFFSIKPPFYKAGWFWTIVVFGLALLVGIFFYRRLLRRKNKLIEQVEIQNKLKEYSLKSLQNQMNPHFVFNSLNTIQHFISTNNEEEATEYLSGFSQLMRDMIENIERDIISLEKEVEFNRRYLELEKIRYQNRFDVQFDIKVDEDLSEIFIPTMLIQPIIENAIKHGVANIKDRRGSISIEVRKEEMNMLVVKIKDNGHGLKKNSNSTHKSKAMHLVQERLELYSKSGHQGSFRIESSDNGTTAALHIPI